MSEYPGINDEDMRDSLQAAGYPVSQAKYSKPMRAWIVQYINDDRPPVMVTDFIEGPTTVEHVAKRLDHEWKQP